MLDSAQTALPEVSHPQTARVRDSSQTRLPLLAFVADEESEAALRGGLLNIVDEIEIRRGTVQHAIKHLAKQPTPRALVIDISGVTNPLAELNRLASVCAPDVNVMVVGEGNEVGLYRHLIRDMGVSEYVHKPLTRDRVTRLFAPQVTGVMPDTSVAQCGSVLAVCGARGGVGTTTVAVNLALQLADATRAHVALLDLHLKQGSTALMLGVQPIGGLRIALEQPERADALFLDRVCVEITERVRLIAADEPLDGTPAPTQEGLHRVLDLLKRRFNYIVMDTPVAALTELHALRCIRHLVVVMTPDLAAIRDTDRLCVTAASLGTCHTTVVLNRFGAQGGLKLPMIHEGLGSRPTVIIPELGKQLARAANTGKPALNDCNAFRRPIAQLAQEISGAATGRARDDGRWFLHRMFRR